MIYYEICFNRFVALATLENDNGPYTGFRGTQRVFEGCKEDLLDIIEGIINDKLPANTRQLPIHRLFESEVSIGIFHIY